MPRSLAKWLSVPSGRTPKTMPVSTSAAATVLTVPSPPPATISAGRRAMALPTAATISSPPCASSISACRPAARKWPASRSTSARSLPLPEPALTMTTIAAAVMVSERPRAHRPRAPLRAERAVRGRQNAVSALEAERQPGDAFGECRGDVAQVVDAQVHARERDERDRARRRRAATATRTAAGAFARTIQATTRPYISVLPATWPLGKL